MHAEVIGERFVDKVIKLTHLNSHQRLPLLLLFCGRNLYLLLWLGNLPIEYAEVHTMRLFSKPPRFLHII